jgi:hypothetical protein
MKNHPGRHIDCRVLAICLVVASAWSCATMNNIRSTEYSPPSGRGLMVILLSGYGGPESCKSYATEIARLGYYAVLFDGKDFYRSGSGFLKRTIEQAQRSPKALPGKAAVPDTDNGEMQSSSE